MSNRLLEDNIELGKALLDICYIWIGGSWLNRWICINQSPTKKCKMIHMYANNGSRGEYEDPTSAC